MVKARPQVEIHSAFAEYRARFVEPALDRWHQGVVMQSLLRALTPWGATLESMSFAQTSARASDVKVSADFPHLATAVTATMGELLLVRNNPGWDQEDETVAVAKAAIAAMVDALAVDIASQEASLGLHLSVVGRTPRELVGRFLNHDAPLVDEPGVQSYGVSLYREDGYWVLDTSRLYSGALFVRLGRIADGRAPVDGLVEGLRRDQTALADALGIGGEGDGYDPTA